MPEVRDEVLLGAEAREQLLSHDSALLGAHKRLMIHLLFRPLLLLCLHLLLLLLIMHQLLIISGLAVSEFDLS